MFKRWKMRKYDDAIMRYRCMRAMLLTLQFIHSSLMYNTMTHIICNNTPLSGTGLESLVRPTSVIRKTKQFTPDHRNFVPDQELETLGHVQKLHEVLHVIFVWINRRCISKSGGILSSGWASWPSMHRFCTSFIFLTRNIRKTATKQMQHTLEDKYVTYILMLVW